MPCHAGTDPQPPQARVASGQAVVSVRRLSDYVRAIFKALGAESTVAERVAWSLVSANLAGRDSHGVFLVPIWVDLVRKGTLRVDARPEVLEDTGTIVHLNGNGALGPVVGHAACELAIGRGRQHGIGMVTARSCGHLGRLGEYTNRLAREGLVGLMLCNCHGAGQTVAPFGGRDRRLTNNSISLAMPARESPIVADMALCAASEARVRLAQARGEQLAEGEIIDRDGQPSTDPADLARGGSLLPLGGLMQGHKGVALLVAVDLIVGVLSGGGTCRPDPGDEFFNAFVLIGIDTNRVLPSSARDTRVEELRAHMKSARRLPGVREIMLPGESGRARRDRARPTAYRWNGRRLNTLQRSRAHSVSIRRTACRRRQARPERRVEQPVPHDRFERRPWRLLSVPGPGDRATCANGEEYVRHDPATGQSVARVRRSTASDVDAAVTAARDAFGSSPWPKDARLRARVLRRFAQRLRDDAQTLADLLVREQGKTLGEARIEIASTADIVDAFAAFSRQLAGRSLAHADGAESVTLREPVGVVAAIAPWNWPVLLTMRLLAPAFAAGNTCVVKPPSLTSAVVVTAIARLAADEELPPGTVSCVLGEGESIGASLVEHDGVDMVAFTGSTATGLGILGSCVSRIRPTVLELGGKSPNIVFADADLQRAVSGIGRGIFTTTGQICTAGSRLLIEEPAYDEVVERVSESALALRPGDGLDPETDLARFGRAARPGT